MLKTACNVLIATELFMRPGPRLVHFAVWRDLFVLPHQPHELCLQEKHLCPSSRTVQQAGSYLSLLYALLQEDL